MVVRFLICFFSIAFKLNDIVIDESSENGESTETLSYNYFYLGTKQELQEQDVSIIYSLNGETESISLNDIEEGRALNFGTLSITDASNVVIDAININGHVIEFEGINLLIKFPIMILKSMTWITHYLSIYPKQAVHHLYLVVLWESQD